MNVKTEQVGGVSVVRVGESRLMYPILGDFLVGQFLDVSHQYRRS